MNVAGNSELIEKAKVLPLFSSIEIELNDPLQELVEEGNLSWQADELPKLETRAQRVVVTENQFPDQSMYLLEQQLASLKNSLGRLKFYLSDLDDLIPR